MRWVAIILGLLASVTPLSCRPSGSAPRAAAAPAAPEKPGAKLVCTYTYAGQPQQLSVPPTRDPYGVKATNVYDRFEFKVVYVDAPADIAGVRAYVYQLASDGPVLIHEGKYALTQQNHGRYGFTGQHFVYDPRGRELSYHCEWLYQ
jgi:hypothetical protein